MREPVWIGVLEALVLHDMQLVTFGGAAGVRDVGLLESALARPRNLLAYGKKKPSLARLAAAYAFGIIKNHPFVDGNKRTALVIAFAFLDVNGIEINASEEDAYRMFMDLASGRVSEEELDAWMSDNSE
ncbi:MAG: type II toxin-antitoxin system death-on-curing family toxin, partial [Acidobacteriia bacterium]|nr:type II toxin-antitoxin system death-on-curing family toxin [Terriglobia bacterium]